VVYSGVRRRGARALLCAGRAPLCAGRSAHRPPIKEGSGHGAAYQNKIIICKTKYGRLVLRAWGVPGEGGRATILAGRFTPQKEQN